MNYEYPSYRGSIYKYLEGKYSSYLFFYKNWIIKIRVIGVDLYGFEL